MCNLSESLIERGEKRGIEKGEKRGEEKRNREIAISLLDILDDAMIAEKVGLPIETVRQLRSENTK